ncbi:MAG: PsbP-related protein [Caldisericia bacterium]|nr:PsbP-related protein [Caldisericia bacterium]
MKKQSSLLLIFFLLLSFSFYSCTPKTTSRWKTFNHSHFAFEYPPDWILEEDETNITIVGPEIQGYFVNVKVDFNTTISLSLEEFMDTVESQNQVELLPDFIDGGVEKIVVNNREGIQRVLQTSVTTDNTKQTLFVSLIYFVIEPSTGLVITTECPVESFTSYKKTLEKIQNSFQFGDQ